MSSQDVLVLGAGGFIGRRIVRALLDTDWARPVAAGRRIRDADLPSQVERLTLDATDLPALVRGMSGASAVVSCIAGPPEQIVRSGEVLFQAAQSLPTLPRIVYLGSMAAYGSATGSIDESAPLTGDGGPYSDAKMRMDQLAASYPLAVRLRPGIVYGPHSEWWSEGFARFLVQGRVGDLGPYGEGICNAVYVDDVASAVRLSLTATGATGHAFNLANPSPPTWNEYFKLYAHELGVAPAHVSGGQLMRELRLWGPFLKAAQKALGGSNPWQHREPMRPWMTQLWRHDIRLDSRKAETVLGLQFRGLRSGLQETARWFLESGRA